MPADDISSINSNFLNQISSDVFPGIQADMEGGLRGGDFHWQEGSAPIFDLSHHGAQVFTVEFPVYTSTKPPGGGTAQRASVKMQVTVGISVLAQGELQLFAQNFIFHTQDKTLLADLNAAKTDIASCKDGLLDAVQLPIAKVKGVSFNGFSAKVFNGALILAASVSGSPAIQSSPAFFQDMGFAFSRTLLEYVLKNSF